MYEEYSMNTIKKREEVINIYQAEIRNELELGTVQLKDPGFQ
jgi:hypothetical protein